MNKLEMAHDYLKVLLTQNTSRTVGEAVETAYALADAMQAEAEKREKEKQDKAKQEQQNYEDALDSIGAEEEWQPDWSQAPDWANWWCINNIGSALFYDEKPRIFNNGFIGNKCCYAPTFNYQGNWQESLRKRPQ